jgi:excisionase family DNA binding protein
LALFKNYQANVNKIIPTIFYLCIILSSQLHIIDMKPVDCISTGYYFMEVDVMVISIKPVTYRVRDASRYLGISEYLLRKLVLERKIAHTRAGKLILFRKETLDAYLSESENGSIGITEEVTHGIRRIHMHRA